MNLNVDLTLTEAETLALFLKRLQFDHFLSCTDGAAGGLDATGGNEEQAYEMLAVVAKIENALVNAGEGLR